LTQVEIVANDDFPHLTDDRFLAMLAADIDVLDTTPADALKGTVRYMPRLATEQVVALPGMTWIGRPDEPIEAPSSVFFGGHGFQV
jgi:hypothetical protein